MWVCVCVLTKNLFLQLGMDKILYAISQDSVLSCSCFSYILFSFYTFDHSTYMDMDIQLLAKREIKGILGSEIGFSLIFR